MNKKWIYLGIYLTGLASGGALASESRPNILFVFADDWGCYASAYQTVEGKDSIQGVVKTPNFDSVAAKGVLFTHAHVTAPSCTPCRSSLLSGQYFWRTGMGAILSGARWDMAIPSYPLLLQKSGYHIGYTYKVWGPGSPADAPYGAPANRFADAGSEVNNFSENVSRAVDREAKKAEIYAQVRANFEQFLGAGKAGQPWCYWFGPTQTHRMIEKGSGKALWGIEPDRLKGKLPKFLPDNEEVREDVSDYLGEVQSLDAALGVLLKKLEERGELENTMIVISGDHGIGGMPRGKCNLYDYGTHVALAIAWPKQIPGGRIVDDFVNLMDLAPTFLEAGGEKPPAVMTGRSLLNVLSSNSRGQVDPRRDFVIMGRERHVDVARDGELPYPQRAIRTAQYLYIRNFKPERWPMGDPEGAGDRMALRKRNKNGTMETDTYLAYPDMDASPTKAWMVAHRDDTEIRPLFALAFGKRPAEELYDVQKDPDQMHNLAGQPGFAEVQQKLSQQLIGELQRNGDPRVDGEGTRFDLPPYSGPVTDSPAKH